MNQCAFVSGHNGHVEQSGTYGPDQKVMGNLLADEGESVERVTIAHGAALHGKKVVLAWNVSPPSNVTTHTRTRTTPHGLLDTRADSC